MPSRDPGSDFDTLWGMGNDGVGGVWAVGHTATRTRTVIRTCGGRGSSGRSFQARPARRRTRRPRRCRASSDGAWAVGSEPTSSFLIAHWDGAAWSAIDAEIPLGGAEWSAALSDVVALSPSDAWAVGRHQGPPEGDGAAETFPLIEHWDGVAWEVVEVAPAGV